MQRPKLGAVTTRRRTWTCELRLTWRMTRPSLGDAGRPPQVELVQGDGAVLDVGALLTAAIAGRYMQQLD
jgi:hypothetical protein